MTVVEDNYDDGNDTSMDIDTGDVEADDNYNNNLHNEKRQKLDASLSCLEDDAGWRLQMVDMDEAYESSSRACLNPFDKRIWDHYQKREVFSGYHFAVMTDACFEKGMPRVPNQSFIPSTCRISSTGMMCIALENCVYLFSDVMVHLATINLNHPVDALAFNEDASFLTIGDRAGILHFLHIHSFSIVLSQPICVALRDYEKTMLSIEFIPRDESCDDEDLVVVLSTQTLLHVSNFDLRVVDAACIEEDLSAVLNMKGSVSMNRISLVSEDTDAGFEFQDMIVLSSEEGTKVVIYGRGSMPMCFFTRSDGFLEWINAIKIPISTRHISKLRVLTKENSLLLLDDGGDLHLYDFKSLEKMHSFHSSRVIDFSFTEILSGAFITILTEDDQSSFLTMRVLMLPDFREIYQTAVSACASLADSTGWDISHQPYLENTFLRFIEQVDASSLKIFVKTLSFTPTGHMSHREGIVSKALSKEALMLDMESYIAEIRNSRAQSLGNIAARSQELLDKLELIDDPALTFRIARACPIPILSLVKDLLKLSRDMCLRRGRRGEDDFSIEVVARAERRLATYEGLKKLVSTKDTFQRSFDSWQMFLHANLASYIGECFKNGMASCGLFIWRRHIFDDSLHLRIFLLLKSLPDTNEALVYVPWIRDEVIPLLKSKEHQIAFAEFVEAKVRKIEATGKPHDALTFFGLVNALLYQKDVSAMTSAFVENSVTPFAYPLSAQRSAALLESDLYDSKQGIGRKLCELKEQLQDIVFLKDEHNLEIPLDTYTCITKESIAIDFLLRAVLIDDLKDAIERNFLPYATRHKLNSDNLFEDYCSELLVTLESTTEEHEMKEHRACIIIDYLKEDEAKATVIIEVMRRATCPWSKYIFNLVERSLPLLKTTKGADIRAQFRLMRLGSLLFKYGISTLNLSDLSRANDLMKFILSDFTNKFAMSDALLVVEAYSTISVRDAFLFRCRVLLSNDMSERCVELLLKGSEASENAIVGAEERFDTHFFRANRDILDVSTAVAIIEELMYWLEEVQEDAINWISCDKDGSEIIGRQHHSWTIKGSAALIRCLDILESRMQYSDEDDSISKSCEVSLSSLRHRYNPAQLENLLCLYEEFEEMMPFSIFSREPGTRMVHFKRYAASILNKKDNVNTETDNLGLERRLLRYGELLDFDRDSLLGIIGEEAALHGHFDMAISLSKELVQKLPNPMTSESLKSIAFKLLSFFVEEMQENDQYKSDFRLTFWLQKLIQSALVLSSETYLSDCLDIFKNYEHLHEIFIHSDAGDYHSLVYKDESDNSPMDIILPSSSSSTHMALLSQERLVEHPGKPKDDHLLADLESQNLRDDFGASLFAGRYKDLGHVLESRVAFSDASIFFLDSEKEVQESFKAKKKDKRHGKQKHVVSSPVANYHALCQYLFRNRCLTLSMRSWQQYFESSFRKIRFSKEYQDPSTFNFDGYGETVMDLAKKVLTTYPLDQWLSICLLVHVSMEDAYKIFKDGGNTIADHFERLPSFAAIGVSLGKIWGQLAFTATCEDLANNSVWWHELAVLDIPFEREAFKSKTGEYHLRLMPALLQRTEYDIVTCLDFAQTYNVNEDYVILEYIKYQLLHGSDQEYRNCVISYIDEVRDVQKLVDMLDRDCWHRVSSFDYERLNFIFEQILRKDEQNANAKRGIPVLKILATVERSAPLQEAMHADLKPRFLRRFPFHDLLDMPQSVLFPEIQDVSSLKYLPLAKFLGFSSDDICVKIINGLSGRLMVMATNNLSEKKTQLIFDGIFDDAKSVLSRINNLPAAFNSAMEIVNAAPKGKCRIKAMREALDYAARYNEAADSEESKAEAANDIQLVKANLTLAETEELLKENGLASYISYITKPRELVEVLYYECSTKALLKQVNFDLHDVVEKIGTAHRLNTTEIRTLLFQKLLLQGRPASSEKKDYFLPSIRAQLQNLFQSQHELELQQRVLYILKSAQKEVAIKALMGLAIEKSSKVTALSRVRALGVLFQLASREDLARANPNYTELEDYLKMLLFLSDFEELQIVQSLKEFQECSKEALARSLWVKHGKSPKALQLVCNLCFDYNVQDLKLWEHVVKGLIEQNAIVYLLSILEHLCRVAHLSKMLCLSDLWQSALLKSVQYCVKSEIAEASEKRQLYRNVILAFERYPFTEQLDSDLFIGVFSTDIKRELGLYEALLGLHAIPNSSKVVTAINAILNDDGTEDETIVSLLKQTSADQASLSTTLLRCSIFDKIDERRAYHVIEGTAHFKAFLEYLLSHDKIDGIVLTAVEQQRLSAAENLVILYNRRYHNDVMPVDSLKNFLKSRNHTASVSSSETMETDQDEGSIANDL